MWKKIGVRASNVCLWETSLIQLVSYFKLAGDKFVKRLKEISGKNMPQRDDVNDYSQARAFFDRTCLNKIHLSILFLQKPTQRRHSCYGKLLVLIFTKSFTNEKLVDCGLPFRVFISTFFPSLFNASWGAFPRLLSE